MARALKTGLKFKAVLPAQLHDETYYVKLPDRVAKRLPYAQVRGEYLRLQLLPGDNPAVDLLRRKLKHQRVAFTEETIDLAGRAFIVFKTT